MGWNGENTTSGTIQEWDGTAYREIATPEGLPVEGAIGDVLGVSAAAYTGVLSFPRNVISTNGTDYLISCGPTIVPAVGATPDIPGVAYASDGVRWKTTPYPDAGYSVSQVIHVDSKTWAIVEDRTTRDLWWHRILLDTGEVVWSGSRVALTRPGGTQQTEFWASATSTTEIYLAFGDTSGRLVRYDATTTPPTPLVNSPSALTDGLSSGVTLVHDPVLGRLYASGSTALAAYADDTLIYANNIHWGYGGQPFPMVDSVSIEAPVGGFATDGTRAYFTIANNIPFSLFIFGVDAVDLESNPESYAFSDMLFQGMTADLTSNEIRIAVNHQGTAEILVLNSGVLGGNSTLYFPGDGTVAGATVASDLTQRAQPSFVGGKHIFLTNASPDGSSPYSYKAYDVLSTELVELGHVGVRAWLPPDEALFEVSLQENIHVDWVNGDDTDTGLTQGTALLTLTEARKRIGDKNGDVTIWLWGSVGDIYSLGTDTRLWDKPRQGYGRLTFRSAVVEEVVTLNVTAATDGIYTVAETLTFEQYDGYFVSLGNSDPMQDGDDAIVLHTGANLIWAATGYGMPSPATITIWRPGIQLQNSSPRVFHGGTSRGVYGTGNDCLVELINLLFDPGSGELSGGLRLRWVHVSGSQHWCDVTFSDTSRVAFYGSPYFERCSTHQAGGTGQITDCIFSTPEFINCGGSGLGGSSLGDPFQVQRARIFVMDVHRSDLRFSDILATGDVLSEVYDSNVRMSVMPLLYAPIDLLSRSNVELTVSPLPAAVVSAGGYPVVNSGLSSVVLRATKLDIAWSDASPTLLAFSLQASERSTVTVNKDIRNRGGVPDLDFSDATGGSYLLADGSSIGRGLPRGGVVALGQSGPYTNYVADVTPRERLGVPPLYPDAATTVDFTLLPNREFTAQILVACADNTSPTSVRYTLAYLVKGTTDGAGIVARSQTLEWSATDDDLTDDPTVEIGVTFGDSGLLFQVTVTNNVGATQFLTGDVYFTLQHYNATTAPAQPPSASPLAAFGGLTALYDYSGLSTTFVGSWFPRDGIPLYPLVPLANYVDDFGGTGLPASTATTSADLASTVSGLQTFVAVGEFPAAFDTDRALFSLGDVGGGSPSVIPVFITSTGELTAIMEGVMPTLIAVLNPAFVGLPFAIAIRIVSGDWYVSLRCDGTHVTASAADVATPAANLPTIIFGAAPDTTDPWEGPVALAGAYTTAHIDADVEAISLAAAAEYGF